MRNVLKSFACLALVLAVLLSPLACLASGGKVTYPDGTPAAGAEVRLLFDDPGGSGGAEMTVTCDGNGRFSFAAPASSQTMLQVRAADGENFAMFTLPTRLFTEREVAIVLQPGR